MQCRHVQEVKQTVEMNRKVTTREITECTNINRETVRLILHEKLGMRKICMKVVPKVLSPDHKQMRVELSVDWLAADAECYFESSCNRWRKLDLRIYDPCNECQSMEWKTWEESRTKESCVSKLKGEGPTAFFDCHGLTTEEKVLTGRTVNAIYYHELMCKLCERIHKKRPKL